MSCFRGPARALIVALSLSLLLLAEGLFAVPGVVATHDPDGKFDIPIPEDISSYTCESGFEDIESKLDMSLHGVTQLRDSALAVGYARRRDRASFGRRVPATLLNRAGGWTRVNARSPGDEDGLIAVASRAGAAPWAVGWTTIRGQVMPLAMRWNGRKWKVDRPKPRGSMPALFTDVTIVGDGSPFAVGYRMTANGKRQPIVIRKSGPRWRTIPINTGKRESITLTGVAPDKRGGLWVVGHGGSGAEIGPVVYRRDDGAWTRIKAPRLRGEAVLTDVIAVSGRDSWAVGYHRHDGVSEPLVLRWDGKSWRKATAPDFGSNDVLLSAVSEDPAGGVWVVGAAWDDEAKSHEAVAAWWDGHAWNEFSGRAGGTELHDVSGSLDEDGWAVGRSGASARATRVCTPLQSGVFGGSRPAPPARTASAEGDTGLAAAEEPAADVAMTAREESVAAAEESVAAAEAPATAGSGSSMEAGAAATSGGTKKRSDKAGKSNRSKKNKKRNARVRVGPLPKAKPDKRIVARDVAREVGILEETGTYDGVVADFDGDGVDDLFIGRHGRKGRLLLNRDGVFVDHAPLQLEPIDRHGCTAADIDGSGLPDLYCTVGGKRGSGLKSNELWLDPGGPAPVEVAVDRGVSDPTGRGRVAAFLEAADRPDVSLVVTNSPTRVDGLPSVGRLFRTTGDGELRERQRPGFAARLGSLAMQDADFDGDGREDLLLVTGGAQAPKQGGTRLYRNSRRGLVEVTRKVGIKSFGEVDAELMDIDGTGRLDLVQLSPTRLRVSTMQGGTFRKVYERKLTHGRAVASGDINGDGRDDLYIVRGNGGRNVRDVVLLNRKGGRKWGSVAIPQVRSGNGDGAYAIDHDGNGLDDFVVLNGHNARGQTQLIAFYPR